MRMLRTMMMMMMMMMVLSVLKGCRGDWISVLIPIRYPQKKICGNLHGIPIPTVTERRNPPYLTSAGCWRSWPLCRVSFRLKWIDTQPWIVRCAKSRVNIFGGFLDIRQNAEWPRFWPTRYVYLVMIMIGKNSKNAIKHIQENQYVLSSC